MKFYSYCSQPSFKRFWTALNVWGITCIQNALCQDCSKLRHNIIVLIIDHFGIELSELADLDRKKEKEREVIKLTA